MKKYIAKRLLVSAASLLAVLFILFLLMDLLPGSPFNDEKLTEGQLLILKEKYGLDRPFFTRFLTYAGNMIKGDLGVSYSIAKDVPVAELIANRLPVSLQVGGLAAFAGGIAGIALGMVSAVKEGKFSDGAAMILTVLGLSLPSYVLALILSYVFGFRLHWFPILYRLDFPLWSSVLPAAALGAFMAASVARVMRAELILILKSEYMAFAESRGVPERRLLFVHALKNGILPAVAQMAPMTAPMTTGSLAVEKIFSIPGTGSLMVTAIQSNDYNVVAGLAFLFSCIYIAVMLAADILYEILNPGIRIAGREAA